MGMYDPYISTQPRVIDASDAWNDSSMYKFGVEKLIDSYGNRARPRFANWLRQNSTDMYNSWASHGLEPNQPNFMGWLGARDWNTAYRNLATKTDRGGGKRSDYAPLGRWSTF